jgi:predicted  nucleic acid-binding Zn-ribbon protein
MNKALIVLSECVDVRNGKRFSRGDEFSPAPNPEQAKRLVAAGCLPQDALKAAVGPKTDAEQALEEKAVRDKAAAAAAKAAAEAAKTKRTGAKADTAATVRDQINKDGLFDLSVDELKVLAESESIDLGEASEKDAIVTAIRTSRAKG